jgi:hypothetical protein
MVRLLRTEGQGEESGMSELGSNDELRQAGDALLRWFESQEIEPGDAIMVCAIVTASIVTGTGDSRKVCDQGKALADRAFNACYELLAQGK